MRRASTARRCPAIPLADTVHQIADDAIVATLDRSVLVAAQTPQCFRADVLRDVLARAAREDADATDEAGLAAKYGHTCSSSAATR